MGKAYASRKSEDERPEADFYATPKQLTWELVNLNLFDKSKTIYEPCAGSGAIANELTKSGFNVILDDIRTTGKDFLTCTDHYDYIITNPPFSKFDEVVLQAKKCSDQFAMIMKTNFFGAYKREKLGVWKNLKYLYIFNRQVSYEYDPDNEYLTMGCLITGWGIWDMNWNENYWETRILDINKYTKNGVQHGKDHT